MWVSKDLRKLSVGVECVLKGFVLEFGPRCGGVEVGDL
jgi:hypothetical protein